MVDSPILIFCPDCRQQLRLPNTQSNKDVRCPRCGHRFGYRPGIGVVDDGRVSLWERLKRLLVRVPPFGRVVLLGLGLAVAVPLVTRLGASGEDPRRATSVAPHAARSRAKSVPNVAHAKSAPKPGVAIAKEARERPGGPIMWRLGDVSPQFEISERHLRRAIERAMSVWEKAAGMKLFVYDSSFGFPIDLVYADQKVLWDAKRAAERTLEHQRQSLTQADRVSDDAMARFTLAKLQFETKRAAYETRLTAYNREVHAVNASGGATPSVEALLETEKANLEEEKARLEGDARGLESLQSEANRLVERRNQQAQEINKAVQAFNTKFGSVNVRLGECERTKDEVTCIRIIAYSDEGHLAIVLAHELGHALGIGDFEADGHLMTGVENGRKSSNSLRLTAMDKAALRDVLR